MQCLCISFFFSFNAALAQAVQMKRAIAVQPLVIHFFSEETHQNNLGQSVTDLICLTFGFRWLLQPLLQIMLHLLWQGSWMISCFFSFSSFLFSSCSFLFFLFSFFFYPFLFFSSLPNSEAKLKLNKTKRTRMSEEGKAMVYAMRNPPKGVQKAKLKDIQKVLLHNALHVDPFLQELWLKLVS